VGDERGEREKEREEREKEREEREKERERNHSLCYIITNTRPRRPG